MTTSGNTVRRFVAEYSRHSDELISRYELTGFDLQAFQKEFGEPDTSNPMYECYVIKPGNLSFLGDYLDKEPNWDFSTREYFIEAAAI